jgi:hypothetical protein
MNVGKYTVINAMKANLNTYRHQPIDKAPLLQREVARRGKELTQYRRCREKHFPPLREEAVH